MSVIPRERILLVNLLMWNLVTGLWKFKYRMSIALLLSYSPDKRWKNTSKLWGMNGNLGTRVGVSRSRLWDSKSSTTQSLITFSGTLPTIDVRLVDRWLLGLSWSPFLKKGVTSAILKFSSTSPFSSYSLKIAARCGATSVLAFPRILVKKSSCLGHLQEFRFTSPDFSSSTSQTVT